MPYDVTTAGRRIAVASLIAAAGLGLTACQDGGGSRAHDRPRPSAASRLPAPAPGAACTPEMLRFHARTVRHRTHRLLLSVTNNSDRRCDFAAQPYPLLRLGVRQRAVAPAIGPSNPGTVVTLAPGHTAFAGITTSDGTRARRERISQFGLALARHTVPCQVGLDSGPAVRVDPQTARVTYWQTRRAAALKW